jgi:hypothetical protein
MHDSLHHRAAFDQLDTRSHLLLRHRAWTTSTVIMRSAINALGLTAEIVHHAVGQSLETELQAPAPQPAGIIEIQRKTDLATSIAQGNEIPHAIRLRKRSIDQTHLQTRRWIDRIACSKALAKPRELEIQPRHQHII